MHTFHDRTRPNPTRAFAALAACVAGVALLASVPAPARAALAASPVGSYGMGHVALPGTLAIAPSGDVYVVSQNATGRVDRFSKLGAWLGSWGSAGSGPGQFLFATGIAVAGDGTVLVVDANNARVQRFSAAGVYQGQFGSSGSGNGQFNNPRGIAVDPAGNVYVADTGNHRVQKFSSAGAYLAQFGGSGADPGRMQYPWGVAVDSRGRLYVADTYNQRVQVLAADGTVLHVWGFAGSGDYQFQFPTGIAVDAGFQVYVADDNNHRIQRYTCMGRLLATWGTQGAGDGQLWFPQSVAVDARGDVHVADTQNNRIQVFRTREVSPHSALLAWGSPGSGNGQFSDLRGVAVAPDGNVYVTDRNGDRVEKFTRFGAWISTWGTSGTGNGQLEGPNGIAIDAAGVVYVTEVNNARVQKFDANGTYLGKWGSLGTGLGQFTGIWDIAIGAGNTVWVVDANRVQGFTPAGDLVQVWSVDGAKGICTDAEGSVYVTSDTDHMLHKFAPDGTPLAAWGGLGSGPGQFFHPADAVVDTAGYVYVADADDRVQQFTPWGGYVTEWGGNGSALNQIAAPTMMAVDPPGNVYVGEFSNYRVQKFCSPPELLSIVDVPNDEGGFATATFSLSSGDSPESGAGDFNYRIVRNEINPPIGTVVGLVHADGATNSVVVPLATSATEGWTGVRELQVQAILPVPNTYLVCTNWGFATDDTPPPAPLPIAGAYSAGATHLHWHAVTTSGFRSYQVWRSAYDSFPPGAGSIYLTNIPDTTYDDPGPAGRWYKVIAVDSTLNQSAPAVIGPDQTVSVPGPGGAPGLAFALELAGANPARGGALAVRVVLPDEASARVELLDVAGRRRWSQEVRGAGAHTLGLDPGRPLPPGLWFVRLVSGGRKLVRRAVVLD